ncbi:MAG: hypothetical protein CML56_06875 [Rhodobacteraceae bacterium]|nr:hypothetical protein [Paracoccaceae bacterium]
MGGLLDHSTNTIILDAVLTTEGRAALARFNGTFQIRRFALGDDEIQYGLIRQFGRVIGKEYIEKLTPVMEANTRGRISCQSHLVSFSNPRHTAVSTLRIGGEGVDATKGTVTFSTKTAEATRKISVEQANGNTNAAISPDQKDNVFVVRMRADQFQLLGGASAVVDDDGVAEYRVGASALTTVGGGQASLNIGLSPQLMDGNRYKGAASTGKAMNIAGSDSQARGVITVKGLTTGQKTIINAIVNKV